MLDPSEIRALLEKQFGRAPTDQHFEYFMAEVDVDKDANIFDDKALLVDGKPHGLGVKSWPDGERYSGDWFEGERSGHGVWTGTG